MKKQIIIFLLISLGLLKVTTAQDQVFFHYENISQFTNPATTGKMDGRNHLNLSLRNRWPSYLRSNSYKTAGISFETDQSLNDKFVLGYGLYSIVDRAGEVNSGSNEIKMSIALKRIMGSPLGNFHCLKIGVSAGFSQRVVDAEKISILLPEALLDKKNYGDLNIGGAWQYQRSNKFNIEIGISLRHINQPNVSLFPNISTELKIAQIVHGRIEIPISSQYSIIPSAFRIKQDQQNFSLLGATQRLYFDKLKRNSYIDLTFLFRNNDLKPNFLLRGKYQRERFSFGIAFSKDNIDLANGGTETYELIFAYSFKNKNFPINPIKDIDN